MPRKHKKRGRRAALERIRDENEIEGTRSTETKHFKAEAEDPLGMDPIHLDAQGWLEPTFFGLLSEQEQQYFKEVDALIEADQFENVEGANAFLTNVYKELEGKELKVASSQSCSRLLEKLIFRSNMEQTMKLLGKFNDHFIALIQHRFASHCTESLLTHAAEFLDRDPESVSDSSISSTTSSMKSLFLSIAAQIEPHFGHLFSHQFASHSLRVLLLILSRQLAHSLQPASSSSGKKSTLRKLSTNDPKFAAFESQVMDVIAEFTSAMNRLMASGLRALDTDNIRHLATEAHANPVLQILLSLEFQQAREHSTSLTCSYFAKLFPDDPLTEGSESGAFLQNLLFDTTGSHLLEVIISQAPEKVFKQIYNVFFRHHLGRSSRNEVAVFVVVRVLQRLSRHDLEGAVVELIPHFNDLFQKSRHVVVKTLIEQSRLRGLDVAMVADALRHFASKDESITLLKILGLETTPQSGLPAPSQEPVRQKDIDKGKIHNSLLAQTLLAEPDAARDVVNNALLALDSFQLILNSKSMTSSRIIQTALTCNDQTATFKRPFTQKFLGSICELAVDPVASHVVDALWQGTSSLKFVREQVAQELLAKENLLHQSVPGRAVWRNWKMDTFKRRRGEWLHETSSTPGAKASIDLARERHLRFLKGNKRTHRASLSSVQKTVTG